MSRLSFVAVECFTATIVHKWGQALLTNRQDTADKHRREYLGMLEGMGWTEEEHDAESLKYIDREWISIYYRSFMRSAAPLFMN